jgi:ArsR family transcriptional regulator
MSDDYSTAIDFLKVLADASRLAIIEFLKEGEKTPTEIQDALKKGQSTISQQLKILYQAGVIVGRKEGVNKYYKVKNPAIFGLLKSIYKYLDAEKKEKLNDLTSSDIKDILF